MLKLENVHAHYGKSHVLQGVNITVEEGQAVALLGRNGVGKTTTLRAIMGLTPPSGGPITFYESRLDRTRPHKIPRLGIGYVPQGRRIFPKLSTYDNLCLGLTRQPADGELDSIFERFPRLRERLAQPGGTLSGGEQQMLAIARALMRDVKLLLLDEPYEGLAPVIVQEIERILMNIKRLGITSVIVEQNAVAALRLSDRAVILDTGQVAFSGTAQDVLDSPELRQEYLAI